MMAPWRGGWLAVALPLQLFAVFVATLGTHSVRCTHRYDRQTLLDIRTTIGYRLPEFSAVPPPEIIAATSSITLPLISTPSRRKRRRWHRGKRAGVLVRTRRRADKPPLPSILLSNVQSLDNKLAELRARIHFTREMREVNILALSETWLGDSHENSMVEPAGFSIYRQDRSYALSGNKHKGGGVCAMIRQSWCSNVKPLKSLCSPDIEYLTLLLRPIYLPREFSAIILSVVYIHPRANEEAALKELYGTINDLESKYPDGCSILVGDFNSANLKKVLPKYFQHVTCSTRGERILDQCWTPFRESYRALPRPPFGRSDHNSVLLLPAYRQKLKREPASTREVRIWSEDADFMLQDCFQHTDWEMFRHASGNNINEFSDSVVGFISKCIDDVVPKKTVRTYPNQKPWINSDVRSALRARDAAFKSGNLGSTRADLQRAIRKAKREYGTKLEDRFATGDARSVWQGLREITDFRGRPRSTEPPSASLPNELNAFFARFETDGTNSRPPEPATPQEASPLAISEADVVKAFVRVNTRKAAGPDGIPGRVLKVCAHQLAGVFADIFNLSLSQAEVPAAFKMSTIVPVPKRANTSCHNDWRPVALTPIVSKCFEKLVRDYICSVLPATLDPWQFAYRKNRSTEDAVAMAVHTALNHLEPRGSKCMNRYVRMLFVDFSSAFNTIVPARLDVKLRDLGLHPTMCRWILSFLSDRCQVVRMGNLTSDSMTLNTGAPQGCVLSPLLYSLYTHDCETTHGCNVIIKYADDTTLMGLINDADETAYREEVNTLALWCRDNNLALNTGKTKELIVDFRRPEREHTPLYIEGVEVERVSEFKFLGIHIDDNLKWDTHTTHVVKKAQQRLYCLRRLNKFRVSPRILRSFYNCTIESILTGGFIVWYGSCTVLQQKTLQRVVLSALCTVGGKLPSLQGIL